MADNSKDPEVHKTTKSKRQNRSLNPNLVFRKRQPQKPETASNVIYVSTKTSSKVFIKVLLNHFKNI